MFYNCYSLKALNIDNFNTSSIERINYIFYNCSSLVSLNLTNFDFNTSNFVGIFEKLNKKIKYCIDDNKTYPFLDLLINYEKNCRYVCINGNSKKYIIEKNLCVDNCSMDEHYKYEYKSICYEDCPKNTELINNINLCKSKKKNYLNVIIMIAIGTFCLIAIVSIIILIICINKKSKKIKKLTKSNEEKKAKLIELNKNNNYLQEKIRRYPTVLGKNEYLITIIFTTTDQKFNYPIICKNTNIINDVLKNNLYKEYPYFKKTKNFILCKGKMINKYKSFESNRIESGNILILNKLEE